MRAGLLSPEDHAGNPAGLMLEVRHRLPVGRMSHTQHLARFQAPAPPAGAIAGIDWLLRAPVPVTGP